MKLFTYFVIALCVAELGLIGLIASAAGDGQGTHRLCGNPLVDVTGDSRTRLDRVLGKGHPAQSAVLAVGVRK